MAFSSLAQLFILFPLPSLTVGIVGVVVVVAVAIVVYFSTAWSPRISDFCNARIAASLGAVAFGDLAAGGTTVAGATAFDGRAVGEWLATSTRAASDTVAPLRRRTWKKQLPAFNRDSASFPM